MSKQKNNEVIRENELGYLQTGDYFIPDLKLPQENRSIGKYGRMHRDYLQEHNPIRFVKVCKISPEFSRQHQIIEPYRVILL